MRGSGCEASHRPFLKRPGWICHGRNLTSLLSHHGIPCVLPNQMISDALAEPWGSAFNEPVPFRGGDHYHLVAPEVWFHA